MVSLISYRNAVKMRMVIAVKRQRTKMMKMTLKKQRRMRMKRKKCCYQAWRGKRRCTPCSCVLWHRMEPRALGGELSKAMFYPHPLFRWG